MSPLGSRGWSRGGKFASRGGGAITCAIAAAWASRTWGSSPAKKSPIRSERFACAWVRIHLHPKFRTMRRLRTHPNRLPRLRSPNCLPTTRSPSSWRFGTASRTAVLPNSNLISSNTLWVRSQRLPRPGLRQRRFHPIALQHRRPRIPPRTLSILLSGIPSRTVTGARSFRPTLINTRMATLPDSPGCAFLLQMSPSCTSRIWGSSSTDAVVAEARTHRRCQVLLAPSRVKHQATPGTWPNGIDEPVSDHTSCAERLCDAELRSRLSPGRGSPIPYSAYESRDPGGRCCCRCCALFRPGSICSDGARDSPGFCARTTCSGAAPLALRPCALGNSRGRSGLRNDRRYRLLRRQPACAFSRGTARIPNQHNQQDPFPSKHDNQWRCCRPYLCDAE